MNLQKQINGFDLTIGGDGGQFIPKLKAIGWGGLSKFSLNFPDSQYLQASIEETVDLLTYTGKQFTCKWYPRGRQGYEWEIILDKKPLQNRFDFNLTLENLTPYYQPELTQAEINEGCVRPPQTVGSYVFYNQKNMAIWNGIGGRFARLLRPKIIDANLKEVWGSIAVVGSTATLIVPQEFLNSAAYPIIIDPTSTFGSGDADGDGSYQTMNAGVLLGQKVTAPVDAESAVSFSFYGAANATRAMKAALILAADKTIVANGLGGGVAVTTTPGLKTDSFATPPSLTPSVDYYLTTISNGTYCALYYDSVTGTWFYDATNSYTTPTDPTDGSEGSSRYYEIYCTYNQAVAGGPAMPVFDHYRRSHNQ